MADYTPVYSGGVEPFTATTSAAVTGGRILHTSGDGTVAQAGAGSANVVGVAAHDAASGARVTVWPIAGVIHETTVPGALAHSVAVVTAANGELAAVVSQTGMELLGVSLTTKADGKARWLGRR